MPSFLVHYWTSVEMIFDQPNFKLGFEFDFLLTVAVTVLTEFTLWKTKNFVKVTTYVKFDWNSSKFNKTSCKYICFTYYSVLPSSAQARIFII